MNEPARGPLQAAAAPEVFQPFGNEESTPVTSFFVQFGSFHRYARTRYARIAQENAQSGLVSLYPPDCR